MRYVIAKSSGEGSRGGKVIGHTRSGKPIYATYGHSGHKDFTAEDHADAAAVHEHYSWHPKDSKDIKNHQKHGQSHTMAGGVGKEINKIKGEEGSYSEKEQRFKDHGKKLAESAEPKKEKPPLDMDKEMQDWKDKDERDRRRNLSRAYNEIVKKSYILKCK